MERRLVLAREAKLASLLPDAGGRLEASGVLAGDGRCYVIFDNAPDIARIPATLAPADGPDLIRQPRGRRDGFEDIAHDRATGRFYVLVEARARGQGFMAEVQEYDERLGYLGRAWVQFPLDSLNKGLEGLTAPAATAGPSCSACARGTGAGTGRRAGGPAAAGSRCSSVAGATGTAWPRSGCRRPSPFEDFSLAGAGDRLAVLSQASAALWVGRVHPSSWGVAGPGAVWSFPPDPEGRTVYCNAEGCRGCRPTPWWWYQTGLSATARTTTVEQRTSRSMSSSSPTDPVPPLRALFQRRVDGDDALLELARLRFDQAGLAAEVYADTPEQLEWVLGFAPERPHRPVVHLSRQVNLLEPRGRATVETFADRFGGRVAGLVVHDKAAMGQRTGDLVAGLTDLGARLERQSDGPMLFLEYAAGLGLDWFTDVAERLREVPRVGACVDVGHVGIAEARASFSRHRPGLELTGLQPDDPRLPELAADVQAAVASALPAVLFLIRSLGQVGKPFHLHLHDGHPLISGLSDHVSFLTRVPVPFEHHGRRSLDPLYGPAGLAAIVQAAAGNGGAPASLTLEIHQVEGRRPLADAAGLFRRWRDLTNAERMNHWLAVLGEHAALVTAALDRDDPATR